MNAWNVGKERKSGELNRITASGALRFAVVVDTTVVPTVTTSADGGTSFSAALAPSSTLVVGDKDIVLFEQAGAMGPLVKVVVGSGNFSILQED